MVGSAVRARCSVCAGVIPVSASVEWGNDFPDAKLRVTGQRIEGATPVLAPAAPPAADSLGAVTRQVTPVASPLGALDVTSASITPGPTVASDAVRPALAAPTRTPPFSVGRRTPPSSPAFGAPSFPPSSLRPPTPVFVPAIGSKGFGAPIATPAPASAPPTFADAAVAPALGDRDGALAPPISSLPTPVMSRAVTPPVVPSVLQSELRPGAPAEPTSPPRRVNPYLSNDPNQKARRLARALVSDMVAYHPQKRDEGTRNGTLKQLFRDEIKKSYEEYVEQIGREFAESTSHFQEALNDILAGGRRVF